MTARSSAALQPPSRLLLRGVDRVARRLAEQSSPDHALPRQTGLSGDLLMPVPFDPAVACSHCRCSRSALPCVSRLAVHRLRRRVRRRGGRLPRSRHHRALAPCVLRAVHWSDPIIFFPERGTLGYTDAFFLLGAADAGCAGSLDAFSAFMVVMRPFRRSLLRIPPACDPSLRRAARPAAVGAFLFAFSNVDAVKLIHVQAYCAMLCRCCATSCCPLERRAARAAARRRGRRALRLLFLTAYQTSWFFASISCSSRCSTPRVRPRAAFTLVREAFANVRSCSARRRIRRGIVPFLLLYVPVFLSGRSRDLRKSRRTCRSGATSST